jgi:hypothetical protein
LELNLKYPKFDLQLKKEGEIVKIFDLIRKKWLVFTPEEYVRQHLIHYLTVYKKYPASYIGLEKELDLNGTKKRFDILVHNQKMEPYILIECKAPYVELKGEILEQALRYNLTLKAHYVMISNGVSDFILYGEDRMQQLPDFPV